MSSSGLTYINELPNPNSNTQLNGVQQQLLMQQQQPQNIILNKNEIISNQNSQMPGPAINQFIPSGTYSTQNPIQTMENNVINQQPNYNELVNLIQKASLNGSTSLPSRDIPNNSIQISSDEQTKPNYIPPQQTEEDYIKNNETPGYLIEENNRQTQNANFYDMLYNEAQLPLIIALVYFLFQLPAIKKYNKNLLPFMFKIDGNPNLYGYIFNSVLFASMIYVLLKVITKLA
jgi:ATP-dependent Zn protease